MFQWTINMKYRIRHIYLLLSFIAVNANATELTPHDLVSYYEVSIDTPAFNLLHMDSLYSEKNIEKYRVKLVFPFIWASDLNSNNYLEFNEFQQVRAVYSIDERISFAVNYELIDDKKDVYLNFKLIAHDDGELICWMRQKLNNKDYRNSLSYFFLNTADSSLNEKANITIEKPLDSTFIQKGLYVYQAYLEDSNSGKKLGGQYDSLMIINKNFTFNKVDSTGNVISTKAELKAHRKARIAELKNRSDLTKSEYKAKKSAIKSDYSSAKEVISKGETYLQAIEDL